MIIFADIVLFVVMTSECLYLWYISRRVEDLLTDLDEMLNCWRHS